MDYRDEAKKEFAAALEHLKTEAGNLRTSRAQASLVENIVVEAYGAKTPLVQLASISVPEARTLAIQPWDKGLMKDIEQAIQKSDLNLNPVVDRDVIRLNFPALTEEKRKELVKMLHQKAEASKVTIKQRREKIREQITTDEKAGTVTEDAKFRAFDDIDKVVKEYHDLIKAFVDTKENDIMTI
jgi:ribosome recycling factor